MNSRTGELFAVLRAAVSPGVVNNATPWQFVNPAAGGAGDSAHPHSDSRVYEFFGARAGLHGTVGASTTNIGLYATNWHTYNIATGTNYSVMRWDGNILQGNDVVNSGFTNALFIGGGKDGTRTFDGEVAEVIVYDRIVSDAERIAVHDYLGTKYNIAQTNQTVVYAPTNFAGLAGWYRASSMPSNNGDKVFVWPDESGLDRHATNNTPNFGPTFTTGVFNGQPALMWDGVSNRFFLPYTIPFTNLMTVIAVGNCTAGTRNIAGHTTLGNQWRQTEGGVQSFLLYDGGSSYTAGPFAQSTNSVRMTVFKRSAGGNLEFWLNATNGIPSPATATTTFQLNMIGAITTDISTTFKGPMTEFIVFTNALRQDELTKLYYTYLRPTYGLP